MHHLDIHHGDGLDQLLLLIPLIDFDHCPQQPKRLLFLPLASQSASQVANFAVLEVKIFSEAVLILDENCLKVYLY